MKFCTHFKPIHFYILIIYLRTVIRKQDQMENKSKQLIKQANQHQSFQRMRARMDHDIQVS